MHAQSGWERECNSRRNTTQNFILSERTDERKCLLVLIAYVIVLWGISFNGRDRLWDCAFKDLKIDEINVHLDFYYVSHLILFTSTVMNLLRLYWQLDDHPKDDDQHPYYLRMFIDECSSIFLSIYIRVNFEIIYTSV